MSFSKSTFALAVAGLYLTGCASGAYKERQDQREKLSNSSGLFCEFVNGEQHPDVDVELNMQMARRCDINKHFVITNFKTSSEMNGIMYCCQIPGGKHTAKTPPSAAKPQAPKLEAAGKVDKASPATGGKPNSPAPAAKPELDTNDEAAAE